MEQVSAFHVHDIEKIIEIYFTNFESAFLSRWKLYHDENCSSKNELYCRQMCMFLFLFHEK